MFLRFLEIMAVVLVFLMLVTQLIVPLWQNRLMFPWFRKISKLEHEVAVANEHKAEGRLEQILQDEDIKK